VLFSLLILLFKSAIATYYERIKMPTLIHQNASKEERDLLIQIHSIYPELEKLDEQRSDIEFNLQDVGELDFKEFMIIQKAMTNIRLQSKWSSCKTQD